MDSEKLNSNVLCIYCYKPATQGNQLDKDEPFKECKNETGSETNKRFLELLTRHLHLNTKTKLHFAKHTDNPCNDCKGIISKFCDLYRKIKCLELELNWQVDKLWNVMKWADRVPSRLKAFKNTGNFESKLEFRKIFKRKCKRHFLHQSPRVSLSVPLQFSKLPKTEILPGTLSRYQENVANSEEVEFTEISTGRSINDHEDKDQGKKTEHILLGWISSLAALIFLYHLEDTFNMRAFDVGDDPLEILNEELEALPQIIQDHQSHSNSPSPNSGNDCDDMDSNDYCQESQQSPNYCSINENDFEDEPAISVNDVNLDVPQKNSDLQMRKQLFIVQGNPEFLGAESDLTSQYEVPVTTVEQQTYFTEENITNFHSNKSLITLESQSDPIVENSDIKFISSPASSPPLCSVVSIVIPTRTVVPESSSKSSQKRISPEEDVQLKESSAVSCRRSLRTKFQCSNCKATFSNGNKFEAHRISCSQATNKESDSSGSDDTEEKQDIKFEIDTPKKTKRCYNMSLLKTARACYHRRTSQRRNLRKNRANYGFDKDEDWKASTDLKPKLEENATGENVDKNKLIRRMNYKCTKCTSTTMAFHSNMSLQLHERYKHSNGHFQLNSTDVQCLKLNLNSLKLEGISVETLFECTLDPDQCSRKFPLSKELENHTKLHDNFTCSICDLTLNHALDLIDHELEHSDDQDDSVFHCSRCDYKTTVKYEVVNHYLRDHLKLPEIEAKCPICQQCFPNNDTVPLTHYFNYHDLNRLNNPKERRVICTVDNCNAYFLKEDQLHLHCNDEHNTLENKIIKKEMVQRMNNWKRKHKVANKNHKCPYCPMKFIFPTYLKRHILNLHMKEAGYSDANVRKGERVITKDGLTVDDVVYVRKAKYFCGKEGCLEKFSEEEDSQTHSKLHGEFPCNFCEVKKSLATDLAIHEMGHIENKEKIKRDLQRKFNCSRCSFKIGRKELYIEHFVWRHLGLKVDKLKCPICRHGFTSTFTDASREVKRRKIRLYQHYIEWHDFTGVEGGKEGGAFKCDKCLAYFREDVQLIQHKDEVHNNKGVGQSSWGVGHAVCQDCGKSYYDRRGLRKHRLVVHKVELKFNCSVVACGRKFERESELLIHNSSDHGDNAKVLICEFKECGRQFATNLCFMAHMKSHQPKKVGLSKPHVCEQCGKSFKFPAQLQSHYRFHQGSELWEFACEVCGKKIINKQKLNEHMRVHTKEKPFICQVCGVAYGHRHNLRIHVNSKHAEIKDTAKKYDTTNFASSRKGKKLK